MGWFVPAVVVAALAAVVWWSIGRARPDLRRRSIDADIGINQGRTGMYGDRFRDGNGPTPNGGPGF